MYNFRTDLADERANIYRKNNNIIDNIEGINIEIRKIKNIKITDVKVENEKRRNINWKTNR